MIHKQRTVLSLRAFLGVFSVAGLVGGPLSGGAPAEPTPAASTAKMKDYVDRLAATSPRDPEGFFKLGEWCEKEGLHEQAVRAFEQAIRIDPDHPQARAALGFRQLGTDWTKGSPAAAKPAAAEPAGEEASAPEKAPKAAASTPSSAASKVAPPARETSGEKVDPKAVASKVEELLLAKKKWAAEALGKLELKPTVYEDEDFLIHTTCESGSPKLKDAAAALKQIKKLVTTFAGRPKGPIWPGKAHVIYMRASTECMRFSEAVDGQRFPEEEGYYIGQATAGNLNLGDHVVFSGKPPEKNLAFFLGSIALDRMGNSDRYVGDWLRFGLAGMVAGSTEEGKKDKVVDQAFRRTAAELEANYEGVSIFKVLESESSSSKKNGELFQAEALTLVAYFYKLGPAKLQKLIEDLKSSEAPPRPEGEDKLFLSQYARFQENAIVSNFHEKIEKLNENWKLYVKAQADTLEKSSKTETKTKNQKKTDPAKNQKNQGGGTKGGGKGGGGNRGGGGDPGNDQKNK
jgi:tetratricopeptide (TPR) repeat protein